jgi:hypothetical protein
MLITRRPFPRAREALRGSIRFTVVFDGSGIFCCNRKVREASIGGATFPPRMSASELN